jgi:hypothetical protein
MTATFQTVSSTREEYMGIIEELKTSAPPELKKGQKRSKLEQSHLTLIGTLESRIEAIDAELLVGPFLLQIWPEAMYPMPTNPNYPNCALLTPDSVPHASPIYLCNFFSEWKERARGSSNATLLSRVPL